MGVNELSRRSALSGLAIAAAAAVVGFVVGKQKDTAASSGTAANGYGASDAVGERLAAVSAVPKGGGLILASHQIVLTREATGPVHAFSAICTHQGCPVNKVADGTIDCPCHGSRFDVRTGAVVAGPAPRPLPSIAVSDRDGGIYTT